MLCEPVGLSFEDGYTPETATGTIVNRDPLPQAWMVRFGRTVGSQVVEGLSERKRAKIRCPVCGETAPENREKQAVPRRRARGHPQEETQCAGRSTAISR